MTRNGQPESPGELVGRGRTSDVYSYGASSVIKIPHADVPPDWPGFEARLTEAVQRAGVPAPEVRDVVEIHGRSAIVFEHIRGPSMWEQMLADPASAPNRARDLAAIQRSLLSVGIPSAVPDLADRLARKIAVAPGLLPAERDEGIALSAGLPRGASLLHGDLHPGNVLMSPRGPVVIDWFDATIGHPVADIVRSSILMKPRPGHAPRHLDGATPELLTQIHQAYVDVFSPDLERCGDQLLVWQAVMAAGRLAEEAESDEGGLLELWNQRR